ncbi:MAG: transcriptional repressor [Actinomycetia bacterium]|nr:transcriptional repressor [Actinomycetes bacterium]
MHPTLLTRLRDREYRITSQRRVVAQVLEGPNVHMTADEVHHAAIEILPEISRATVYSTLNELTQLGELLELSLDGRSKRYDPNIAPAHHHLVCDHCGQVFDVRHEVVAPQLTPTELHGMTITRAEIVYHGTCASCTAT